jgi:PilZ domain
MGRDRSGKIQRFAVSSNALLNEPDNATQPALGHILFGRFMLPDMSEHPCQVPEITLDGAIFLSAVVPPPGQSIVAYLEELGRVEAISAEPLPGGFRIRYSIKGNRLEKLHGRIKWLLDRQSEGPEARRHPRFEPRESQSQITLPDGRVYYCEVIDISVSGAGIKVDVMPSLGTYVMLGKMRGRVVRYLDNGVAIEFIKPLDRQLVNAHI